MESLNEERFQAVTKKKCEELESLASQLRAKEEWNIKLLEMLNKQKEDIGNDSVAGHAENLGTQVDVALSREVADGDTSPEMSDSLVVRSGVNPSTSSRHHDPHDAVEDDEGNPYVQEDGEVITLACDKHGPTQLTRNKDVVSKELKKQAKNGERPLSKSEKKNIRWQTLFAIVEEYHDVHGHCRIKPEENKFLNNWLKHQRRLHPPKDGSVTNRSAEAEFRADQLSTIGFFDWCDSPFAHCLLRNAAVSGLPVGSGKEGSTDCGQTTADTNNTMELENRKQDQYTLLPQRGYPPETIAKLNNTGYDWSRLSTEHCLPSCTTTTSELSEVHGKFGKTNRGYQVVVSAAQRNDVEKSCVTKPAIDSVSNHAENIGATMGVGAAKNKRNITHLQSKNIRSKRMKKDRKKERKEGTGGCPKLALRVKQLSSTEHDQENLRPARALFSQTAPAASPPEDHGKKGDSDRG